MPARRDPQWTNIPLPTMVTAQRSSTRQERLEREQKKKKEEEEAKKRRKMEEQMAKILAQRWAQEDQKKSSGGEKREDDRRQFREDDGNDGRRRRHRRRDRDEELPPGYEDGARRQDEENRDGGSGGAESADAEIAGGGQWLSIETARREPISISTRPANDREKQGQNSRAEKLSRAFSDRGDSAAESSTATKPPAKKAKVAGVFGLSDSDDEKDTTRRELENAARSKQVKMQTRATPLPSKLSGGASASTSASASAGASGAIPSSSDVQMRLAQFKMTCKGKWVEMPEDLRRDVDRLMGNGGFK